MDKKFKPFNLTIKVTSKEKLVALWLLANSNETLEENVRAYSEETGYLKGSKVQSPFTFENFLQLQDAISELGYSIRL